MRAWRGPGNNWRQLPSRVGAFSRSLLALVAGILRDEEDGQKAPASGVSPLLMIAAFAFGCVTAGFLTVKFGLASVIMPAVLLCLVLAMELRTPESSQGRLDLGDTMESRRI